MKLASRGIKFVLLLASTQAMAKNLSGRTGMGISNIGGHTTEAISLDWQPTQATGFELNLGLDTQNDSGGWEAGFRASRNLFIEDNMLFSLFLGASVLQQKVSGVSDTGYMLETGVGAKFFLEGLPNLAFGFRGALQIADVGKLRIKIAPLFSLHYYF